MCQSQKEQALILMDRYSSIWSSIKAERKEDNACLIDLAQEVQKIKSVKKMKAIPKAATAMIPAEFTEQEV